MPSSATSSSKSPSVFRDVSRIVKPYIRLCRINGLLGVWLTFWPCAWGTMLAAYVHRLPPQELLQVLPMLFLGCMSLHSAACTINDIFDVDMDRQVERTKTRPLPSGTISMRNAWIFFFVQMAGFLYLLTWTNPVCAKMAIANLPFQIAYPLIKRFSYWTSAFLGITFGWGSLIGWSAMTGSLTWEINAPLYAAGVCWAFGYDTLYAFMDKKDDVKAGVKSTALILQNHYPRVFLLSLATGFVGLLIVVGKAVQATEYFNITVLATALHVGWQVLLVDFDDPSDCFRKFYTNSWIGWVMLPGLLLNYSTRVPLV